MKGDGQRPLDEARVIMPERVTIKRVRIPFAESLRFPGEGKSAQGESAPKARPKGVADGRQVNIPAPVLGTIRRTLRGTRAARQSWPSRKGEGTYDPEVSGGEAEKSHRRTTSMTVLKPTQVGEMKILRRSRERS